jgi:hypothetical protein
MEIKFTSEDILHITGRGEIKIVDLSKHNIEYKKNTIPIKVGDIIDLDNEEVKITGIEYNMTLMDPPTLKPTIGLRYQKNNKKNE